MEYNGDIMGCITHLIWYKWMCQHVRTGPHVLNTVWNACRKFDLGDGLPARNAWNDWTVLPKKKRKILFYLVMLIYPITFPINTNGYIYILSHWYIPLHSQKWYLYFILHFAAMISFPCRKGDSPRCSLIVSGAMFQWKISIGSRDSQLLRSFWEFTGDFP